MVSRSGHLVRRQVAGLPMYDWPEVHDAVDALWAAIAQRLRGAGLGAPERLWRYADGTTLNDLWTDPELLIGQACGLPVVTALRGRVEVLGSLDHGIDGCELGDYRSVLVCRSDDETVDLPGFRGRLAAVNSRDSQSGFGSLVTTLTPLCSDGSFLGGMVESGSHRESLRMVADGRADLAAIDEVCWRLGLDHEPAVDGLRIFGRTDPTPGLPLVTGWVNIGLRGLLNAAITGAVESLEITFRKPLHLYGYRPRPTSDYQIIVDRLTAAGHPIGT